MLEQKVIRFLFLPFLVLFQSSLQFIKVEEQSVLLASRFEGKSNTYPSARNSSPSIGQQPIKQQRWISPTVQLRDVKIENKEIIFRKVRSILNKLTPEKFEKLCQEILNIGIDSKLTLKGIVVLIYDKAVDELNYSSLYANLCRRLYHEGPNFDFPCQPGPSKTFRNILIAKLQDEFENRNKRNESVTSKTTEDHDQRFRAKKQMLGNIKFIGELYRLSILQENILHNCIKELINKKKKESIDDLAEDLECLCQIMTTCGRRLDHNKAKLLMDQYFARINYLQRKKLELPSRIRFMLQDILELRKNAWTPRHVQVSSNQGPKTLDQVRSDLEEVYPSLLLLNTKNPGPFMQNNSSFFFFSTSKKSSHNDCNLPSSPPSYLNSNQCTSPGPGFDFFSPPQPQQNIKAKVDSGRQACAQSSFQHNWMTPTATSPSMRKPSTTTDIFQPPFQHAIDKAKILPLRKTGSANRDKQKVTSFTAEEITSSLENIVDELTGDNVNEKYIVNKLKEIKPNTKQWTTFCSQLLEKSLCDSWVKQERVCAGLKVLCDQQLLPNCHIVGGLHVLLTKNCLEANLPRMKTFSASLLARMVITSIIELKSVAECLQGGLHFPLFLLVLQQIIKHKDKEWLLELFRQSHISLHEMMPETSRDKRSMFEMLKSKQLAFLLPFLRIELGLTEQLNDDASPSHVYRWIRENVDALLHSDPKFIHVLITCCLNHVTKCISSLDGVASKNAMERKLLSELSPLMCKFVHDNPTLQLQVLYDVQAFCYNANFPKGLMLRLFQFLYDDDVVDEESFIIWKEDFNDIHPGKGKSLFQVNAWLTWLQEADTEEDENS